jgi:hypothetical protein
MATTTKTKKVSAHDSFLEVESHEAIRRDSHERICLEPGDAYPQGDLIFWCIDKMPKKGDAYVGRQLAPGTTQGSRHLADGNVDLYIPDEESATEILARLFPKTKGHTQFFGPVILVTEEFTATHPEHGHRTFVGTKTYLTTYQKVWMNEIRRVHD